MLKKIGCICLIWVLIFTGCDKLEQIEESITETAEESPQSGGTLNLYAVRPDTLNPLMTKYEANRQMLNLVYDPLIRIGTDVSPVMALAESISSSEGGILHTVHLKSGVTWHDGSAFSADDVVYTLRSVMNSADSVYKVNLSNVVSVSKVDTLTVQIRLNYPDASFANLLEIPIIPQEWQEGVVTGTGRYVWSDYDYLKSVKLEKNASYYGAQPYIDGVTITILPDEQSVYNAFMVDITDVASETSQEAAKYNTSSNISYERVMTQRYSFVGINCRREGLNNVNIRRALMKLVNRDKLTNDLYADFGIPTKYPIHPQSKYYRQQEGDMRSDAEQALALLSQEGYELNKDSNLRMKNGNPLTFELLVHTNKLSCQTEAEYIAAGFAEYGIQISVKLASYEEYLQLIQTGNFDLYLGEMNLMPNYALSFLLGTGGAQNYGGFSSSEMDAALSTMAEASVDSLAAAYGYVQEVFESQAPHIPLFFEYNQLIYDSAKLGGIRGTIQPSLFGAMDNWYVKQNEK